VTRGRKKVSQTVIAVIGDLDPAAIIIEKLSGDIEKNNGIEYNLVNSVSENF